MNFLSYKTDLLVQASAKLVGDLHAFSVHPVSLEFSSDGSKVTLRPNEVYLPKLIPLAYGSMTMELLGFNSPPYDSEEHRRMHCLCPVRATRAELCVSENPANCLNILPSIPGVRLCQNKDCPIG